MWGKVIKRLCINYVCLSANSARVAFICEKFHPDAFLNAQLNLIPVFLKSLYIAL